jgi:Tol biopolymer transport system component
VLNEYWNAVLAGEPSDTSALDPAFSTVIDQLQREHVAEPPSATFADDLESTLRSRVAARVPGRPRIYNTGNVPVNRVAVLERGPAWHKIDADSESLESVIDTATIGYQAPSALNHGRDGIYLSDRSGSRAQMIAGATGLSAQHVDWAPDGDSIVFVDDLTDSIWIMSLMTLQPVRLSACDLPGHFCDYPAWSPDGNQIAFTRYEGDGKGPPSRSTICVLDLRSGAVAICAESRHRLVLDVPRWSPDGNTLVIGIDRFDQDRFETGSTIATLPASGGEPTPLLPFESFAYKPDWNRVTGQIVFSTETIQYASDVERLGQSWNLFVISPSGQNLRQVTDVPPGTFLWQPTWTPDGSAVIATRDEGLRRSTVRIDPGTGSVTPLFSSGMQYHPRPRPGR